MGSDSGVPVVASDALVARDESQAQAIKLLRQIASELQFRKSPEPKGVFSRFFKSEIEPPAPQGLYLWGGVGRGKTWLMDRFYQSVPIDEKVRLHFHRFIQLLHKEMQGLPPGINSLQAVVQQFTKQYRLLCLDEFQVGDIGDAMLLQGVLKNIFHSNVTLVTTSNREPNHLYKGGVLQDQMLPAIKLLEKHCKIFHLDGAVDYRLAHKADKLDWYILTEDENAEKKLENWFRELSTGAVPADSRLEINNRVLQARKFSASCAWFEFEQLCMGPRAVGDYIQLAERFGGLIISSVPVLHEALESAARRFMNLVDELYDSRVRLVLCAETQLEDLYSGDALSFEFQRTLSRLYEMQSIAYLDFKKVTGNA